MIISMRAIEWTFCQEPLRKVSSAPHANGADDHPDSKPRILNMRNVFWDACDLTCNFRGLGWNWAKGYRFPKETRPTDSTPAFLARTVLSAAMHYALFDVSVHYVRAFSPTTFGCPEGGSIFDPSMPPFARYARSSAITLLSGVMFYAVIQWIYDLNTINVIILFRHSPYQWPPLFDAPWRATSISEFWGRRWHQLFRSSFTRVGAQPLEFLVGRVTGVLGAFFVSAVIHDWGMWPMGHGFDFGRVGGFFGMMGVGCILEALFRQVTGVKVQGPWGWIWTMSWTVGWGNLLVDAWGRSSLLGSTIMTDVTSMVLAKISELH